MLSDIQRQELARQIYAAERDRVYISPVTESYPGTDIIDAYAIAQYVTQTKVAAGRRIKGHKIGLTSKAMRDISGANEPDYGTLFDDWFVPEGSTLSYAQFNRASVELELAFVLRQPLSGPALNVADVIRATDYVLPAIEIVDSRYTRRGPGPLVVDSVADAAWCSRIVLGGNPRRLDQLDVRNLNAALYINGEQRDSGVSSAVMGNPLNAVAWLANKLAEYGVTMEAGHVIMSGSFIKVSPFKAGDTVVAKFDEFGDVSFTVSG